MATTYNFSLTFLTNRNENLSINIPHASPTASPLEVRNAMADIIATGIVITSAGEPQHRTSAELITVGRRDFELL